LPRAGARAFPLDAARAISAAHSERRARRGSLEVVSDEAEFEFDERGDVVGVVRDAQTESHTLIEELMILANSPWGELLSARDVAALYRVQSVGKVRMSVHPEPHEGLGVSSYAWMSSPLRRDIDLANQWQLVASLSGRRPPFTRTSDALLASLRAFEVTYARYDEHQRAMEDYWSLRWLEQEGVRSISAVVLRENLVRLEGVPLVVRVASLPAVDPGSRVRLEVQSIDLLERSLSCLYRETLGREAAAEGAAGVA
jgi:exoribonuclease-2